MQTDRRTIVKDLGVLTLLVVIISAPALYKVSQTEPIAHVIMYVLGILLIWIAFASFIVMPPQNVLFALFFGLFISMPINIAFIPIIKDIVEKIVHDIPSLETKRMTVAYLIHLFIAFLVYFALLIDSRELQRKKDANS